MGISKESALIGTIGLLAGLLIAGGGAVLAVNNNNRGMMQMMGMDTSLIKTATTTDHMGMSMSDMSNELVNRTGDDFDKNFILMMIAHHQGAIDMAKLAESRARHEEVKQLSRDIVAAQTTEINSMKQWQQAWGYDKNETDTMQMMH